MSLIEKWRNIATKISESKNGNKFLDFIKTVIVKLMISTYYTLMLVGVVFVTSWILSNYIEWFYYPAIISTAILALVICVFIIYAFIINPINYLRNKK